MLGKKNRLTGSKDYDRVEKEGKVFQSENFGVAVLERGDVGPTRVGFVVSTKVAKDAVDRNRFKRIMSEAVRMSMTEIKTGFDVVFLAKTTVVRIPTDRLMKEVKISLKGSELIK